MSYACHMYHVSCVPDASCVTCAAQSAVLFQSYGYAMRWLTDRDEQREEEAAYEAAPAAAGPSSSGRVSSVSTTTGVAAQAAAGAKKRMEASGLEESTNAASTEGARSSGGSCSSSSNSSSSSSSVVAAPHSPYNPWHGLTAGAFAGLVQVRCDMCTGLSLISCMMGFGGAAAAERCMPSVHGFCFEHRRVQHHKQNHRTVTIAFQPQHRHTHAQCFCGRLSLT